MGMNGYKVIKYLQICMGVCMHTHRHTWDSKQRRRASLLPKFSFSPSLFLEFSFSFLPWPPWTQNLALGRERQICINCPVLFCSFLINERTCRRGLPLSFPLPRQDLRLQSFTSSG